MAASSQEVERIMLGSELSHMAWQAQWGWTHFIHYNLDSQSGNTTHLIEQHIPQNAKVRVANGSIIGSAHNGTLRNFSGTSVSASSIEYGVLTPGGEVAATSAGESAKAFILDFGGIRKIKALAVAEGEEKLPRIVMVLPWMGIEFGSKPVFPYKGHLTLDDPGLYAVSFSEVETSKLFVQFAGAVTEPPGQKQSRIDEVLDKLTIISNTMPLNTKVAVGNRPPFYTHAGELKKETPLPDFSRELNGYLNEIRAAGAGDIENFPLMITMDAPGKVSLGLFQVVYDREAQASWGDSHRQTLSFDGQGTQTSPLNFFTDHSKGWRIHRVSLDITHEFPQWRTFPRDFVTIPDRISASVCPDLNIAQCLPITETTDLYGVGVLVSSSKETSEILIELQGGNQGEPDNHPIFEQVVSIKAHENPGWVDLMFSRPLPVVAGKELWCVMKSKLGQLSVVLDSGSTEKPALFNRNSSGYRRFPYHSGNLGIVFRQHRKPVLGEAAGVVSLTIAGVTVESDLPQQVNTLDFFYGETSESTGPVVFPENNRVGLELQITAHASGSITFQKVIAHYQQEPGS